MLQPVDQLNGEGLDLRRQVSTFDYYTPADGTSAPQSAVGYAWVILLGKSPSRLDCGRLYELEIQKLKAEIEMLKVGLE